MNGFSIHLTVLETDPKRRKKILSVIAYSSAKNLRRQEKPIFYPQIFADWWRSRRRNIGGGKEI
jgi:hypothetical protein